METNTEMLTIQQAADEFGIPRIKLWRWIKSGRLVAYRSGRDERVKLVWREDIARLLQPTADNPQQKKNTD